MPSATPELQAKWPGMDREAMQFLEAAGYTLTPGWEWIKPNPGHPPTEREISAMQYLIDEWDFGGMVAAPAHGG